MAIVFLMIGAGFLIYRIVNRAANHDTTAISIEPPVMKRAPTDGVDFLIVATNAFMNKGKTLEEVKIILKQKGLIASQAEIIATKALELYEKWLQEQNEEQKAKHLEKIENISKPLPDQRLDMLASGIVLTSAPIEKSAGRLATLMGTQALSRNSNVELLRAVSAFSAVQPPVKTDNISFVGQSSFKEFGGTENSPYIRTVSIKGETVAAFPYLKTETVISFKTKNILEVEHKTNYNIEADINGTLKGDFEIGFYATDYSVNRIIYKSQPKLNICITAFSVIVKEYKLSKGQLSGNHLVGFFPNHEHNGYSYFNFIGKIIKVKASSVSSTNLGCVLSIALSNSQVYVNPFVVDVYVNNENIDAIQLKKEMLVEGLLWFQGEIAPEQTILP